MAIKRLTIELDDSDEKIRRTDIPESLKIPKKERASIEQATTVPDPDDTDANEHFKVPPQTITTGRTFSDLVTEFINNPRAMATILMIIPFLIFVANINSIEYLKIPIITGIIFNLVWFGVPIFIKTINYIKRLSGT